MNGDILWDSISNLNAYLTEGTVWTGSVQDDESSVTTTGDGTCNLTIDKDSTWIVTGDSTLTSLNNAGTIKDADGNTVTVKGSDGTVYVKGTSDYTIPVGSYQDSADTSGCSAALQDRKAPARLPMAITAASPAATHWMIRFCIVPAPFPKSFGSHRTKPSDGLGAGLPLVRAYARCHRIRTGA